MEPAVHVTTDKFSDIMKTAVCRADRASGFCARVMPEQDSDEGAHPEDTNHRHQSALHFLLKTATAQEYYISHASRSSAYCSHRTLAAAWDIKATRYTITERKWMLGRVNA